MDINFQNRMKFGVSRVQNKMAKSVTLEYTKAGSTTKTKATFTCTFEKMSDEALKEQTTFNKDSMIIKILCADLTSQLGTTNVKGFSGATFYINNIKYNVITQEISSDEVLMKIYLNTVV